jgi:Ca2+-binding EF-hand superfamily protein
MEMDENADTYITRDEAKVNRPLMEHFNKLDKNNDNKLDKSELAAF